MMKQKDVLMMCVFEGLLLIFSYFIFWCQLSLPSGMYLCVLYWDSYVFLRQTPVNNFFLCSHCLSTWKFIDVVILVESLLGRCFWLDLIRCLWQPAWSIRCLFCKFCWLIDRNLFRCDTDQMLNFFWWMNKSFLLWFKYLTVNTRFVKVFNFCNLWAHNPL